MRSDYEGAISSLLFCSHFYFFPRFSFVGGERRHFVYMMNDE